MDVKGTLPTLADSELTNIRNNARRLIVSGSPAQRTAAEALMPSIEAELTARNTAKTIRRNEAQAARRALKEKRRAG